MKRGKARLEVATLGRSLCEIQRIESAAMMKSLRWRPPILCVHKLTITRFARSSSSSLTEAHQLLMVFLDKTPILSWSSSSLVRHSAEGRRRSRQVRHEGFAMCRHAPDRGQQLAHRRDHRDFAGFVRSPKAFIVLTQSRVAWRGDAPDAGSRGEPEQGTGRLELPISASFLVWTRRRWTSAIRQSQFANLTPSGHRRIRSKVSS